MNDLTVAPYSIPANTIDSQIASSLNPPQKAAIILSILEPPDAAELMREFNEAALLQFAHAVSELKPMPPGILRLVVSEFLTGLDDITGVRGGVDQLRAVLEGFLDADEVNRIVGEISDQAERPIWDRISDAPTKDLAEFLQREHPQTVSYVLAKMKSRPAANVLEIIEKDLAQASVIRLSRVPTLAPEVAQVLHHTLEKSFLSALSVSSNKIVPEEVIANLMNNISEEAREEFLANLTEKNEDLAKRVIKTMFTFADIATRVEPAQVTMFTKEVEEEDLLVALKHAETIGNPTFDFVLSNLSKRMSERYREDIEAMEQVNAKEAEAIQSKIVEVIQRKVKMGEMNMIEQDDG